MYHQGPGAKVTQDDTVTMANIPFDSPSRPTFIGPRNAVVWHRFFRGLALLVCAFSLAIISPSGMSSASAQDRTQEARERFLEGRDLYDDGEYKEAAAAFLEAYELSGRTELLYNVGQAYRYAGAYSEAERYFQQYLAERPDAPNAEEVVETIIEIQQAVAASTGTLSVRTRPAQMAVFINDESDPRCTSPCEVSLPVGNYTVRARKEGYAATQQSVEIRASSTQTIDLVAAQSRGQGKLLVRTDIKSGVLLVAPHISEPLPLREAVVVESGRHIVEVRSEGKVAWRGEVDINNDETLELFIPMLALAKAQEGSSPLRITALGLGGGALAFGVGAILMGLQASGTHGALEAQQASFGVANADLIERGRSQALGTNILWAAAGASLATGAGLFFWDRTHYQVEPAQGATVYPVETGPKDGANRPAVDLLD